MIIRPLLIAFVVVASATTSRAVELHEGENIIAAFVPSADEWDEHQNPTQAGTVLWTNKTKGNDQYVATIRRGFRTVLAAFRDAQDAPGKERCDTFTSTTIDEGSANGYPRLIWRTLCERDDGAKSAILHLALQGDDRFYHIMRIWRLGVTDPDVMLWTARFKQYIVCDTRKPDHPCSEGAEPAGGE